MWQAYDKLWSTGINYLSIIVQPEFEFRDKFPAPAPQTAPSPVSHEGKSLCRDQGTRKHTVKLTNCLM